MRPKEWARVMRWLWGPLCLTLIACHSDMYEQERYEYQEPSSFFADGRSARPLPVGSVEYGQDENDSHFYSGRVDGDYVAEFPFAVDGELLSRGQQRYEVFCLPCHGITGAGNGFVAQRGSFAVPSLHDQRLRDAPEGYFFDVITNGIGRMYEYGSRVEERDRWAIIAYIRALQLSRNATLEDVPPEERSRLTP
jgi:mono/diheme cytochrome c family protein